MKMHYLAVHLQKNGYKVKPKEIVLFFISGMLLYNSCTRCPKKDPSFLYVSPEGKSVIPYLINDTINFRNNDGEIAKYVLTQVNSSMQLAMQVECPPNYHYEQLSYTIKLINKPINQITFDLYLDAFNRSSIFINVWLPIKKPTTKYVFSASPDELVKPTWPARWFDSLTINGFNYKNVRMITNWIPPDTHNDTLFYNKEYGILKMVVENDFMERIP